MEHAKHHHSSEFQLDEQQAGFMLGAVLGAVVGGAAALLLTPKNGQEMRTVVRRYAKELEKEAYELAKESRGVAKSFKEVLEEGATEVAEQAPQRIEQAGTQAQLLADDLSQRFESARDVVAELAEAFRSGWEEYGEDHPAEEVVAGAPALIADEPEEKREHHHEAEVEEEDEAEVPAPRLHHSRRRVHAGSESAYAMHASRRAVEEKPEEKHVAIDPEPEPVKGMEKEEVKKEDEVDDRPVSRSYTTRVIEEPRRVESKMKVTDEPKAPTAKKKLLFRRGGS